MNLAQHILIASLRLYQLAVSPILTALFGSLAGCRFTPTCSAFAIGAVREHGAVQGVWLAARRLARCHPWGGCGHDPVPAREVSPDAGGQGNAVGAGAAKGLI